MIIVATIRVTVATKQGKRGIAIQVIAIRLVIDRIVVLYENRLRTIRLIQPNGGIRQKRGMHINALAVNTIHCKTTSMEMMTTTAMNVAC